VIEMKVLLVAGLPGSGKSTITKFVANKQGFPVVETGEMVYEEAKNMGLPITPENLLEISKKAKTKSDSYFTERACEKLVTAYPDAPLSFIIGVKSPSEVDFIKSKFGEANTKVIAVLVSRSTRYKRVSKPKEDRIAANKSGTDKGSEDKALSNFNVFVNRDRKELAFGIGNIIALADYFVVSDDSLYPYSEFKDNCNDLESIIKEIIGTES
jgi:dephospho-CoA kinase